MPEKFRRFIYDPMRNLHRLRLQTKYFRIYHLVKQTGFSSKKALIISGAIVGSVFYMINFPMLSLTFAALYGYPIPTVVQNQMSNFLLILPSVAAVTLLSGAVIGIIWGSGCIMCISYFFAVSLSKILSSSEQRSITVFSSYGLFTGSEHGISLLAARGDYCIEMILYKLHFNLDL